MDSNRPGYSVYGISQVRILEWVAIFFFRGSSQPRDWTYLSLAGGFFITEPTGKPLSLLQYDWNVWWMRSCVCAIFMLLKNASVISFPDLYLISVNCCDNWCWSWNSNTLATWCEELTHWKRPWCRERLKAGVEGDDGGWDGWMASPTQWTWIWVNSRSWQWTGRPGVLQSMRLQRVRHDWVTELNWTDCDNQPPSKIFPGEATPIFHIFRRQYTLRHWSETIMENFS